MYNNGQPEQSSHRSAASEGGIAVNAVHPEQSKRVYSSKAVESLKLSQTIHICVVGGVVGWALLCVCTVVYMSSVCNTAMEFKISNFLVVHVSQASPYVLNCGEEKVALLL